MDAVAVENKLTETRAKLEAARATLRSSLEEIAAAQAIARTHKAEVDELAQEESRLEQIHANLTKPDRPPVKIARARALEVKRG